ncbi:hypothetical protein [Brevibacillus formosus]|uniref:Uncharacterized protein n=1 Tax=Brevibacillus formosus TaxID=54913 RepID=A0ABQ0T975_9BACL|nr:hypothetical protein BFO01nite_17550 [Brevibacillus formosus]
MAIRSIQIFRGIFKKEDPGLQIDFIRVETDIKITKTGFGVDELKVKDWSKEIE